MEWNGRDVVMQDVGFRMMWNRERPMKLKVRSMGTCGFEGEEGLAMFLSSFRSCAMEEGSVLLEVCDCDFLWC